LSIFLFLYFIYFFILPIFIFYIITIFSNLIIFYTFSIMAEGFQVGELVKRGIKYLVEGLMVAIAAYAIPKRSLNLDEVALIALTAAATFSILDTYIPSMGVSARSGAGFGIGANLVGFPRVM
jgi:hypothetical protein